VELNSLYDVVRPRFLNLTFDWVNLDIALVAWRGSYIFDPLHATVADVTAAGGELVAQSLLLLGKEVSPSGYARSLDAVFPAVPPGAPITFLTMIEAAVSPAPLPLICYIDEAEGMPYKPMGLDITVQPDWLAERGWWRP
jgi:hypothetical protein